MRGASRIAGVAVMLLLLGGLAPAAATGGLEPYGITSASLSQDGQHLVWQVTLDHPFSARGLRRHDRSLCLVVRPRTAPSGSLCVVPRRGRIALRYVRGGAPHVIAASISRLDLDQVTATFLPSALGADYTSVRWRVVSGRDGRSVSLPARSALLRLHVPKLIGCRPSGSSPVYSGPAGKREIALTFDDGPWHQPPPRAFVRLLARYQVPATFFEIGEQIPIYDASGAAERQMLAHGDMIGDHSWSHPDMVRLSPRQQRAQIEKTVAAVRRRTGFTPCLFRPPGGDSNARLVKLARSLGMLTVMWDVDPRDWSLPGTSAIVRHVVANAHSGAIVIEHFGGGPRYETVDALPAEIRDLRARGYRLVSLTQLLGLRLIYK